MASFKTTDPDREWKVRLTVGSCDEIKRDLGLDIGNALRDAEKFAAVLTSDPGKLVGVLWVCCERQAVAAGITPEAFAGLFDGETLDAATEALLDSVVDFFPRALGREGVRKGLPGILSRMERATIAAMEEHLNRSMPSEPAGNTPGSSGSIPAT